MIAMTGPVVFERQTRHGRERVREVWTGKRAADLDAGQLQSAATAGYEL